ncbi:DUF6292 family protein [Kibdelosporangium philippinense]|uniref:DUF6292 family protein n=2 Tax=Kibdelosporangium philippinense TaxID=211113 RepID=A0ABS8ZAN3_9PSEU|nr:DUF6292 family protein [Kibdelosporangium philippinense]MCE7003865.1 DUF6292 family protein [Kibdelosporangium philippinense]
MNDALVDDYDSHSRGLRAYVASVAARLGIGMESCCVDTTRPSQVYMALDHRLDQFPGRDLALLWDEGTGWHAALDPGDGQESIIVAKLYGPERPEPATVLRFVGSLNEKAG